MSPLSLFVESSLFNLNDPLSPLVLVFTLVIETNPETAELLIPDEIITFPYLSDPPLPLINDTDHPVVLPELGVKPRCSPTSTYI